MQQVEWVEIDSAEDVENALVGDELILWDGCDFAIDYVETEVECGTSFFANGTEATHYLRGLTPPKDKLKSAAKKKMCYCGRKEIDGDRGMCDHEECIPY
jgi:hypothetical protein